MRWIAAWVAALTVSVGGSAFAANLTPDGFSAPQRTEQGCFVVGQYDDGFWIGLGRGSQNKPFVLLGHMQWAALVEGRRYVNILSFPGHLQTTLKGSAKSGTGILYQDIEDNVLYAFASQSLFYIEFGGMFAGPYNLKGSAAALKRVHGCASGQSVKSHSHELPDTIPGPDQEAERTALYSSFTETTSACDSGKDGTGNELSSDERLSKCLMARKLEQWVASQGGCVNDAWGAVLTSKECKEVAECMDDPEPCD